LGAAGVPFDDASSRVDPDRSEEAVLVLKYSKFVRSTSTMAQYKHDRFFKFYIKSLYRSKGDTRKNIQIHNDEDLEIDLMFVGDLAKQAWQQQDFGLFDRLMQTHPTMIIEHYSGYLEGVDVDDCITRKNLYWRYQRKELIKTAKSEQNLTSSEQLPKSDIAKIDLNNPFTWVLTVNCGKQILKDCAAQAHKEFARGVYLLPNQWRMGIVIIEQLAEIPEHLWLKMLGNRESARRAFSGIDRLSTPDRTGKNDIMAACLKYCVYLKDLAADSLTTEESEFMKTMEEIDVWYEAQMLKAKLEGEQLQKQSIAINMLQENILLETIARITGLTIEQLQQLQSSQENDRNN
jgi:hypothetical protein